MGWLGLGWRVFARESLGFEMKALCGWCIVWVDDAGVTGIRVLPLIYAYVSPLGTFSIIRYN